ncbi:unnamed protein product, partial [Didymodactylos carnosus]
MHWIVGRPGGLV